jgi:hypothetical protein
MPIAKADQDPELVKSLVESVMSMQEEPEEKVEESDVVAPPEVVFELPGGLHLPGMGVQKTIEVRELSGHDEQAISRVKTNSALSQEILLRGIVSIGDLTPSKDFVNAMLAGDRDFALLKIFTVTFGPEVTVNRYCPSCDTDVPVTINLDEDVPVRELKDEDRYFEVKGRRSTMKVTLPTGITQAALQDAGNKTYSELSTILLANTVLEIDGRSVLGEADVLSMPVKDRRVAAEAIAEKTPGPRLQDIVKPCPVDETPLEVPLSLAALFQF